MKSEQPLLKNNVIRFYNLIEEDNVYYFSKCQVKQANKKFYEISFTAETMVELCEDVDNGESNLI